MGIRLTLRKMAHLTGDANGIGAAAVSFVFQATGFSG